MKLSLVIPAHNEEHSIEATVMAFHKKLAAEKIDHEILVINDNSKDSTEKILKSLAKSVRELRYLNNTPPNGFGFAVRAGLDNFKGDCVAIVMADMSDRPIDLVAYYRKMVSGNWDCVFGSRFIRGGKTIDYPRFKLVLNRFTNMVIRVLFGIRYNDITNAFKLYRRETIEGLKPFLSHHFNLTVELPLKAIVRGYTYAVVPNHWTNRKEGESKLKLKEMGSRYFFIILYVLLEKWLSRGDYKKSYPRNSRLCLMFVTMGRYMGPLAMILLYVLSFVIIGFWLAQKALAKGLFPKQFLYIASLAGSLSVYYALFYLYIWSPSAARVVVILLILLSAFLLYKIIDGFRHSKELFRTARSYYLPPAVITLIVLFAYCLNFYSCLNAKPALGGYDETTNPPFCSITGLPFDNALPYIYGNNILAKQEKKPVIDWTLADRPPLQIAATLPILDFARHIAPLKKFIFYNVFAIFLQLGWIGAVWGSLKYLKVDRKYIPYALLGLATVGFFYLNSVFVWPKLLSACLVIPGVIIFLGKRDINYKYLPFAAVLISLGLLSHDGIAFTVFPFILLMLYKVYKTRAINYRYVLISLGLALVLLLPWSIYKGTITKNDRLAKWQLAGVHSVKDTRSTLEAIIQQYGTLSFSEWASYKKQNTVTLFTGDVHRTVGCNLSQVSILNKCLFSDYRSFTFFSTFLALEAFNFGWFVFLYRATRHRLDSVDLEMVFLIAVGLVFWIFAMFEPASTIVHQGSYATMILLFLLLIRSLVTLPVKYLATLAFTQTVIFYLVWVSGFYKY